MSIQVPVIIPDALQQLADDALQYAAQLGASDCVVQLDSTEGQELQVRRQFVEHIQSHQQQSLVVTVYKGQQKGSSSSNQLDIDSIKQAIARAYAQAGFAEADSAAGVAEESLLATSRHELDLYHPQIIDHAQIVDMICTAEQAAFDSDNRIVNSEGAAFRSDASTGCLATSRGFNQVEQESDYSMSCVVVAKDAQSQQVDYWYDRSRQFSGLGNPVDLGRKTAQRAVAKLGSRTVKTGKYPVLLVPDQAKGFWSGMLSAISGAAIYRRSSFLMDYLNREIYPKWLTLKEKPHVPRGFGSSDFDAEGVATSSKCIIDQGVLTTWLLSCYSARKLGLQSTGNAATRGNIVFSGRQCSVADLLSRLDRGMIVTDTMGNGFNMVTGDFSVGAQGLWVDKGEIVHPVEEVTIAGQLHDMYKGVVALGDDIDSRGSILTGSVLLEQMTVGGS